MICKMIWNQLRPSKRYEKPENKYCCICMEIEDAYKYKCGHIFGKKCIERWREQNNTCPVCRCQL